MRVSRPDGAAIIEHFEAANGRPCQPAGPRQQIISALFDVIGTDGLLRPAMHYRWNYPEDNLDFIHYHFLHYLDYLDALNAHFEQYPYLLGWQPSIGDFGLLAPMYAHLGRDPHPARLMQQRATRVYRWVERMNRADQDVPEYFTAGTDFLADDEVPETLLAVLRVLAEDFVPETRAAAGCINAWLAEHRPEAGAAAVGRLAHPLGNAEFTVRGQTISALAQPYRFYLLQRVQAIYAGLAASDRASVEKMLEACGMSEILTIRLDRQLGRSENLEVWQA